MPAVGLGVWQVAKGPECERAVRWALEIGYRLIDTAQIYENEASVGQAIRDSGIPREDVFLTTKFDPRQSDPLAEVVGSLRRLRTDYLDLYLVHWPQGEPTWAWRQMEEVSTRELAKAIGVSNFSAHDLDELQGMSQVRPAVNQVQISPFEYRRELIDESQASEIVVQSYSPLGTGRHLANPTVKKIAAQYERSPAQILVRWATQKQLSVIPKSVHRDRIEENLRVSNFELDDGTMVELDSLDTTNATDIALQSDQRWWS